MVDQYQIIRLPVGQMSTNCYLVKDRSSQETIIIDPGDDTDFIGMKIQENKCKVISVIATHGHFDHIMAVTELKLIFNIPFYFHKKDKFLVDTMRSSAKYFLDFDPGIPPAADGYLKDGEIIKLGKGTLKIIETPGHTPGSICLYEQNSKIIFTGDLLFADGAIGRTDFAYSRKKDFRKSLKKIFDLPPEIRVYPGHGNETFLSNEKRTFADNKSMNLS